MIFKNLCIVVLWTKVASALEGLKCCSEQNYHNSLDFQEKAKERAMKEEMEKELSEKDRQLQELLRKHTEVTVDLEKR